MTEILIETKIKGVWTRYEAATEKFKGDPEDMSERACRIMACCIIDNDWPGSDIRATWDEGGGTITLLASDPMLDEYIVDARENYRVYAEAARHIFRSAS